MFEGESMKDWYKGLQKALNSRNSAICELNKFIIKNPTQKDICMFNEIWILFNKRSLVYNSIKNEINKLIYEILKPSDSFKTEDKTVEYLL